MTSRITCKFLLLLILGFRFCGLRKTIDPKEKEKEFK